MLEFEDARSKAFLVDLDEGATAKETDNPEALLNEWIRRFKRREEEKQFPTITGTLREGGLDKSQETELFHEDARTTASPARHFQTHGWVRALASRADRGGGLSPRKRLQPPRRST